MMADKKVAMDRQTEHFNRVHTQTQYGKYAKTIPKAHFDINNLYIFQMMIVMLLLLLLLLLMMMMMTTMTMMISISIIFLQLYF